MAGRSFQVSMAALVAFMIACAFPPDEKPLDQRLLFTSGSAFLNQASTLAVKGKISFEGGRVSQSGSFQLFISGPDSLSFLVEGPFGAEVFRMIIAGDSAYLLSNREEGWLSLHSGEKISINDYGIENISPALLGLFAFPQYYLRSGGVSAATDEYTFKGEKLIAQQNQNDRGFMLFEPQSRVAAIYGKRKNFNDGYFPSQIRIFEPEKEWQITLAIDKIRLNPQLPDHIWLRD